MLSSSTLGSSIYRPAERTFSFGPFQLIPARQLLLRDGTPIAIGSRALDLLTTLVQRRGDLVGKNELMIAAWPDTFVHECNLKVNICSLRRALGDTQKVPEYVATVPGRGYRFVAEVSISTPDIANGSRAANDLNFGKLPARPEIVGRAEEIAHILAGFRATQHVTIVGAGGIGKTSLAVAAAHAAEAADFQDGICFVDLSTFDDPVLLPAALAAALGVRGNPDDLLIAAVEYLRQRNLLLVLDNCEHVLPAAAIFARKFGADPGGSRVLATSREPLRTPFEQAVRLGPLAFPDSDDFLSAEDAMRFPAIELFARRASEWAGSRLSEGDYGAVAQICRALDGLPLAIELAAEKMENHTAQQLLTMLDDDPSFGTRRQGRPARHETLRATMDWSFRLLCRNEAAMLRLVSVFADAFEFQDVAAIADVGAVQPDDVTICFGGLVAKSLVVAEVSDTGIRYRLLDSTRRYASERLHEDPMAEEVQRRYAERILAVFEKSEEVGAAEFQRVNEPGHQPRPLSTRPMGRWPTPDAARLTTRRSPRPQEPSAH
jgi:predicted ATPase/DNA-binding winged helix-turn-helix (wHTH) protein